MIGHTNSDQYRERLVAVAIGQTQGSRRQEYIRRLLEGASLTEVSSHIGGSQLREAERILETCESFGITDIPITEEDFPPLLRETSSPPPVLYLLGERASLRKATQCIGVVGTRSASIETCQAASQLALELCQAGWTIVSGLALGIDGAAHRGALGGDSAITTIAVLAHGLDRVYPASHQGLSRQIISKGGVLLSEYPPGTEPLKHHFLARNRIIAGLSRGVIVVQAGARSGSLVTAQFAADYGRDVFILAADTADERSAGGASMLEQGAIAISSARGVLLEYGLANPDAQGTRMAVVPEWRVVTIESFVEKTGCSNAEILRLEIQGLVLRLPGNRLKVPVELICDQPELSKAVSG